VPSPLPPPSQLRHVFKELGPCWALQAAQRCLWALGVLWEQAVGWAPRERGWGCQLPSSRPSPASGLGAMWAVAVLAEQWSRAGGARGMPGSPLWAHGLSEQLHRALLLRGQVPTRCVFLNLKPSDSQFTHLQLLWAFVLTSRALLETCFGHHAAVSKSLHPLLSAAKPSLLLSFLSYSGALLPRLPMHFFQWTFCLRVFSPPELICMCVAGLALPRHTLVVWPEAVVAPQLLEQPRDPQTTSERPQGVAESLRQTEITSGLGWAKAQPPLPPPDFDPRLSLPALPSAVHTMSYHFIFTVSRFVPIDHYCNPTARLAWTRSAT